MKKLITICLAVLMTATMSTTAFAAETTLTDTQNSKTIDVTAKYTEGFETVNTISANVSWGAMEFTYHVGGTKTWDAVNHVYVTDANPVWQASGNTVTVENHSDVAVDVTFAYAQATGFEDITGTLSVTGDTLDAHPKAADSASTAAADSVETTLTLEGVLDSSVTANTKVGTITVTIGE